MQTTAAPKTRHELRPRWVLAFQDALGTPEDEILDRSFDTEAGAMAWAREHPVVPLWLEEREELLGEQGRVIGSIVERHEV